MVGALSKREPPYGKHNDSLSMLCIGAQTLCMHAVESSFFSCYSTSIVRSTSVRQIVQTLGCAGNYNHVFKHAGWHCSGQLLRQYNLAEQPESKGVDDTYCTALPLGRKLRQSWSQKYLIEHLQRHLFESLVLIAQCICSKLHCK